MRILIVEDETDLAETLTTGLRGEGFTVDAVHDGDAALTFLGDHDVDVVLLDRDLPALSGDAVCRALAAIGHPARILMLTAAGTLSDRVTGLDLGADDYLAKPFAYLELLARIRALGRRGGGSVAAAILEHSGVRLDPARRLAERDGKPLRLTPKELGVLQVLLESAGGVVTPAELLDQVWTDDGERSRSVVKVVVHALRRKLGEPSVIITESGLGYRMG
ncbi:response regulator transcription factor [Microlunatus parietis]|uniref:DNA-binding response OmpR family regulator n=1 Tax=Microlunatus parietis TaxID=682979 RepID=A0A7Y9IEB6_9ACTN|nr:response regulator transcription factor [Microlunatus parietis]NYE75205.1 DNA-binding response OmpR family regulator [Microlunatus parietis]